MKDVSRAPDHLDILCEYPDLLLRSKAVISRIVGVMQTKASESV